MEINTKYHGNIQVTENEIIQFDQGIPGFLNEKEFVLLPLDQESPFFILQSKNTSELGFVVVNPFLFLHEYEFDLSEADEEALKLKSEEDVQVFAILTVREPFEDTTANLQAPIIINRGLNRAKQIILNGPTYTTKHKLFAVKQEK